MKIITCDLCKRNMGRNIETWKTYLTSISLNGDSDICNECRNIIAEAQNKAIEEIINSTPKDK